MTRKPLEILERHVRVLKAIREGKSYAVIAEKEGYTHRQVNQIALRYGIRRMPHMAKIKGV